MDVLDTIDKKIEMHRSCPSGHFPRAFGRKNLDTHIAFLL